MQVNKKERGGAVHEFEYYKHLGEYSAQGSKVSKKALQAQYREMMTKRQKWGNIAYDSLKASIDKYERKKA